VAFCGGNRLAAAHGGGPLTLISNLFLRSGALLQVFAYFDLLKSGGSSNSALVSIAISALTTGFSSATLSYDMDTDPLKRREHPRFYGYIPHEPATRTLMFVCLTFNSAALLGLRSFSASLLMMLSKRFIFVYVAVDVLVFFAYLIYRKDFRHHMQLNDALGFLMRLMTKVIGDWTGLVHLRHPVEMSGLYFTASMALAIVSSFVCTALYFRLLPEGQVTVVPEETAWTCIGLLAGVWALTALVFIKKMNKEYRHTFFDTSTATDYIVGIFASNKDEQLRSAIFKKNKEKWRHIRPQVKQWVNSRFGVWEKFRPQWYTPAMRTRITAEFFPKKAEKQNHRGQEGSVWIK
jgi:hypothetical protein